MFRKPTKIEFDLTPTEIDYFKLEQSHFKDSTVVVENVMLSPEKEFLSMKHLQNFDHGVSETVVLNFQVGLGKTELCYDLATLYHDAGYYVIICSPFLKLVEKDTASLRSRIRHDVFSMELVKETDEERGDWLFNYESKPYTKRIHVMTINCLLGNSGDDYKLQLKEKRKYLNNLLKATENAKVILFLDEVHESVHNFDSKLMPNFLRWFGCIHKVFISSATFTPSTLPVIEACSMITNNSIKVYQSARRKGEEPTPLTVHLLDQPYNSKSISFLNLIKGKVVELNKKGMAVSILTATKAIANSIAKACYGSNIITDERKLIKALPLSHVNLCTQDTQLQFQQGQNNIGTTFKTGQNLINAQLFIVFPAIAESLVYSNYGIFTDGIPSIIQSMGRLRRGGDVHAFLYKPNILLAANLTFPEMFKGLTVQPKLLQNQGLNVSLSIYKQIITPRIKEINLMEKELYGNNAIKALVLRKREIGFWYPNQHEFLLRDSSSYLQGHNNCSFGRLVTPYILHGLLCDQFTNVTLKEIVYYNYTSIFTIDASTAIKIFTNILGSKIEAIKNASIRQSIDGIAELVGTKVLAGGYYGVWYKTDIAGTMKIISSKVLFNRKPELAKIAIEVFFNLSTGGKMSLEEKEQYIRSCMEQGKASSTSSPLITAYKDLYDLGEEFSQWIQANCKTVNDLSYIDPTLYKKMTGEYVNNFLKTAERLRALDVILSKKAISFLQTISNGNASQRRKSIFQFLNNLYFDQGASIQIDKVRYVSLTTKKLQILTEPLLN